MNTPTKKILIAEDEKPMAKALELKLNKAGFDTKVVYNGEDALTALTEDQYDLAIIDLVMPKLDGFSVMAEIKKRQIATPIIVASNLSQQEDAQKAIDLGATNFFVKSNTPINDIVQSITDFLNN